MSWVGRVLPDLAALDDSALSAIIAEMDLEDLAAIADAEASIWENWARPEQLEPPGPWRYWLSIAGRGGGKTWTGSHWVCRRADQWAGTRIALVGATKADVRDVMVEDPRSGILACASPWNRAHYQPSLRRVTWQNGSTAILFSADEPEQTRGLNGSFAWADELGKWKATADGKVEAWDNLTMGIRIEPAPGVPAQIHVSTTPRRTGRAAALVKEMTLGPRQSGGGRAITPPEGDPAEWSPRAGVIVRRWSTDRNARNLAGSFLEDMSAQYGGTTLEAQERRGEILDDVDGALWTVELLESCRTHGVPEAPSRVLVAVDPSHSADGSRDEAGIIVGVEIAGHAYLIDDRTVLGSPLQWGQAMVQAHDLHRADGVVVEVTAVQTADGRGHLVRDVIKAVDPDRRIKWIEVHAATDKRTRAEPVHALYEAGRVHHVMDTARPDLWAALEDELVSWTPSARQSPNRLDAMVHLVTALLLKPRAEPLRLLGE